MKWAPVEPLVDTPEQRRYWREPQIGDRVRVRLSGECQEIFRRYETTRTRNIVQLPPTQHVENENGRIGTIDEVDADVGHPYIVAFDQPLRLSHSKFIVAATAFAACELEILS